MVAIVRCPHCAQSVVVPATALPTTEVRCPLCQAEYPLGEPATESLPELIVVSGGAEPREAQHEEIAFEPAGGMPHDDAAADSASEPIEADDTPDHSADTAGQITWNQAEPATGLTEPDFGGAAPAAAVATSATKKKKRRGPGPIGHFIGIVGFGFIGLVLGYFILKWIKPEAAVEIDQMVAAYAPWLVRAPANHSAEKGTGAPSGPSKRPPKETPPATPTGPPPKAKEPEPAKPDQPHAPPMDSQFRGRMMAEAVTPAELSAALTAARQAYAKTPNEVGRETYMALCDLGHALALLDHARGPEEEGLEKGASELLEQATPPDRLARIESFAGQWLFSGKRPADRPGIWLAGRVEKIGTLKTSQGKLVETVITLTGKETSRKVAVLSVKRPEFHEGDAAAVLGTIVTSPAQQLPWYTGDQPLLILSGVAMGLPEK